ATAPPAPAPGGAFGGGLGGFGGFGPPTESREPLVNLDAHDLPFREAMAQLCAGTGQQFTVDPGVPDVPVTIRMRDVPLKAAVRTLTRLAAGRAPGLTFTETDNVIVFRMRS